MGGSPLIAPEPTAPSAEPGSPTELEEFRRLQSRLAVMFQNGLADRRAPSTVVVVPSLSLDQQVLAKIPGVLHYEERMLCMLMLLKSPLVRIVYVTGQPIAEEIVDYYLHLLQGTPAGHARRRLTLLSCFDASPIALTEKILARPRLMARIRDAIPNPQTAYIACFSVSAVERTLAVRLQLPLDGCDPALLALGSKSGSRKILRGAGVRIPDGFEDLGDAAEVAAALAELKARKPSLRKAVVKLNEGFSGEGNRVFRFDQSPADADLVGWVRSRLPGLASDDPGRGWDAYQAQIGEMGAVVEEFIEGAAKQSPSAQFRIDPLGHLEVISTHDQVLGGSDDQVFLGCRFPADESYRLPIQAEGLKAAGLLRERGVIGRFAVDFICVRADHGWRHYAIEINLRNGGTTHPFMMLQALTGGSYDPASGCFHSPAGRTCCYHASDNLESPRYRGLTPADLIDIAVLNGIQYNAAGEDGVVFHLLGALSEFGKLGLVCVGHSQERADQLYTEVCVILDRAGTNGT